MLLLGVDYMQVAVWAPDLPSGVRKIIRADNWLFLTREYTYSNLIVLHGKPTEFVPAFKLHGARSKTTNPTLPYTHGAKKKTCRLFHHDDRCNNDVITTGSRPLVCVPSGYFGKGPRYDGNHIFHESAVGLFSKSSDINKQDNKQSMSHAQVGMSHIIWRTGAEFVFKTTPPAFDKATYLKVR